LVRSTEIVEDSRLETILPLQNEVLGLGQALQKQSSRVVDLGHFSAKMPRGPWPHPPTQAIILPLPSAGESSRGGLLLCGLSPYRLLNEVYSGFLNLVAGQIAAALSDAEAIERDRRRLEAMAELDRAKTAFFANVSHEFRTPLTLMLGPLQDVISQDLGVLPPRVKLELETVRRNGLRLQKLVNALLDFSRLEAGRLRAEFRRTDVGSFTAELASAFTSAVHKADLQFIVDSPPTPAAEQAYVDRDLWEKTVLNLVSNALKHTFEGSIRVVTRGRADEIELTVADTGIGIAPVDVEHLFERFRRVEGARARSHEGSGIGLALVHEIVKLHGGKVTVTSRTEGPNRGSEFKVTIPLGRDHLPADQVIETSDETGPAPYHALVGESVQWLSDGGDPVSTVADDGDEKMLRVPVRTSGARVLVADDNPDMRGYVARLLGASYQVNVVPDGQAALDTILADVPDLVVTDAMMPRMDGFELVKSIRMNPEISELPVIMLSARAGEESRIEGLDSGADDYLVKPFSARELVARVDSTLALAKIRREARESLQRSQRELQAALALMAAEKHILEMVTSGASVQAVLDELSAFSERLSDSRLLCSILLLSEDGRHLLHGSAPSLHPDYNSVIHGVEIGPNVGSCGTAAYRRDMVSVSDIEHDPLWRDFRDLALGYGLRACTSRPIFSSQGDLLGTVAMYYREARSPSPLDLELTERAARMAGVVIERDRALSLAEAERTRLRDLFSRAPALVCVLKGAQHVFELANPTYLAAVGRATESELRGKPIREALPEIDGQGFYEILDEVYETGTPYFGNEILIRLPRDTTGKLEDVYMNFVYQPSRNIDGKVDGILVHGVDVTQQVLARARVEQLARELDDKVKERTAELTKTNEQLQGFTYSVAHDLRQQIRRISINASMVLQDEADHLDPGGRDKLLRMVGGARQLSELVDDLLSYAKYGIATIQPESVNLSEIATEIALNLEESGQYPHAANLVAGPTPLAFGDRSMIRIILENLIENAFKYSGAVEARPVEFGFSDGAYFVRDNGIGFDMQFVHKLFLPFERLHSDPSIAGTGIGLANVRRLVEKHGGKVWAEGRPGAGATFWFTLPAREAAESAPLSEAMRED
jgi:signal transduction histidine kinase/CheY-like chemotaxis protein